MTNKVVYKTLNIFYSKRKTFDLSDTFFKNFYQIKIIKI